MSFFRNLGNGRPNGEQNEAKNVKKPPTTLQDVQRALEEQDSQLQAAYRALTNHNGDPPIALPASAIERLDEACAARPRPSSAPKPTSGIRC